MRTITKILLASILASVLLTAGPVAKAVVLNNNGNPHDSIAKKAVKVNVANEVIDSDDGIVEKTVKAKAVRGDYRQNRQVRRATH